MSSFEARDFPQTLSTAQIELTSSRDGSEVNGGFQSRPGSWERLTTKAPRSLAVLALMSELGAEQRTVIEVGAGTGGSLVFSGRWSDLAQWQVLADCCRLAI
jgi:hypothetical protein